MTCAALTALPCPVPALKCVELANFWNERNATRAEQRMFRHRRRQGLHVKVFGRTPMRAPNVVHVHLMLVD